MGLLDSIVASAMKGMMGSSESQALPAALSQFLGNTNLGSIGGLLAQLQQAGLGNQVASWLGKGTNMPVSPDQLRSALGDGHLQQMGSASGIPIDQLLHMLAQGLPGTVDRMSPNGVLQEDEAPSDDTSDSLAEQAGLSDIKP